MAIKFYIYIHILFCGSLHLKWKENSDWNNVFFTLVQIPNRHSLRLKTVNNTVTGVEEITPEQSSLSLTTSLKLSITQMNDRGFGLIEDCSGVISSTPVTVTGM